MRLVGDPGRPESGISIQHSAGPRQGQGSTAEGTVTVRLCFWPLPKFRMVICERGTKEGAGGMCIYLNKRPFFQTLKVWPGEYWRRGYKRKKRVRAPIGRQPIVLQPLVRHPPEGPTRRWRASSPASDRRPHEYYMPAVFAVLRLSRRRRKQRPVQPDPGQDLVGRTLFGSVCSRRLRTSRTLPFGIVLVTRPSSTIRPLLESPFIHFWIQRKLSKNTKCKDVSSVYFSNSTLAEKHKKNIYK